MRTSIPLLLSLSISLAVAANAADDTVYYYNPDWSPDGSKLAFESNREGELAIYTIDLDGSSLSRLTSAEVDDEQPRWSPDGDRLVFISMREGHLLLFTMNADGTDQRALTSGVDDDYGPAWSPDGSEVVFQSRTPESGMIHRICVIGADGSNRRCLTDFRANDLGARWSRDGGMIAFTRAKRIKLHWREMSEEDHAEANASREIVAIAPDGSNERNLTRNENGDCCAYFSPDGTSIYFRSDRDGSPGIWIMALDGTDVRRVADGVTVADPRISPDGTRFAYTKEVDGEWGVYVYEIASGNERRVVGGKE